MSPSEASPLPPRRLGAKAALGLAVMAGFLWLAFRQISLRDVWRAIEGVRLLPLAGAFALQLSAHFLRAWRWTLLLHPTRPRLRRRDAFAALMAGYAVNTALPRAGEIVRAVLLRRYAATPLGAGLSSVLNERLMDLVTLAALFPITLLLYRERFEAVFPGVGWSMALAGLAGVAGLAAAWALGRKPERLEGWTRALLGRLMPARSERLAAALGHFFSGLSGLFHRKSAAGLLALSLGIWILYAAANWVMFSALPLRALSALGFADAVAITLVVALAFAIPAPGGTGTTHYFVSRFLTGLFGAPAAGALAFATLVHAVSYVPIVAVGTGCFLFFAGKKAHPRQPPEGSGK